MILRVRVLGSVELKTQQGGRAPGRAEGSDSVTCSLDQHTRVCEVSKNSNPPKSFL